MTLAEFSLALRTAHVSLALTSGALFVCHSIGTLFGADLLWRVILTARARQPLGPMLLIFR